MYKIETVDRSTLYYDQYRYAVTINIHEASCLRCLDSGPFERALINARHWADTLKEPVRKWTTAKELALREARDVLLSETEPYRTVVSFNTVSVYTNNVKIADRFVGLGNSKVQLRLVRKAALTLPAGVIQLRESQHGYRTYFRERRYNKDQRQLLLNFLESRQGTLRPSPALMSWLRNQRSWGINIEYSKSYYFVDHDHPNEGTMIGLVMPGLVRKTMPIEIAK